MEVRCCGGMVRIVRDAIAQWGRALPLDVVLIGVRGEKHEPAVA
jgi:hypothetical protein